MDIKLLNVRLSFPSIFRATSFKEGQEPTYKAILILDKEKHAKVIEELKSAINKLAKESFDKKALKKVKLCLYEGDEKEDTDGYGEDVMFITTSSRKRIPIVDRDRSPLVEEDGKPYAGCFVNVAAKLWAQDNDFGKRINCQLRAMQFVGDGDAFGDASVDVEEEFEDLGDDGNDLL